MSDMDSDKDLPFGDMDRVSLEDDPRRSAARRKAAEISRKQAEREKSNTASKKRKKPAGGTAGNSNSSGNASALSGGPAWWVALVIFLLLLGLGYWSYTQIHTLQTRLDKQQGQATASIDTLKSQISKTGSSTSKTTSKMQGALAKHSKELRRLAANDRQTRKRVKHLENLTARLQTAGKTVDKLKKQLADMTEQLQDLKKQQKEDGIAVGQLQMQQDINTSMTKELTTAQSKQQKQMAQLSHAPASIKKLQKETDKLQKAVHAFDRWRVQVNKQLQSTTETP